MCEFCTKHGDGKIWYRNAANYANDLLSDIRRRKFITEFLETTMGGGLRGLGRLEQLFMKKRRLPQAVVRAMEEKAKAEHFGQVLPIEEISGIMKGAMSIVRLPCACRWTMGKKEERCCFAFSYGPDAWYSGFDMGYFGMSSAEGLEPVTADEAIKQMEALEEQGAIHSIWTMMTPFIGAVCNCSAGDCMALRILSGIGVHTMACAEHTAVVDRELCTGCGICSERCQFDAIKSRTDEQGQSAYIDHAKCYGCGLCRRACSTNAISVVLR